MPIIDIQKNHMTVFNVRFGEKVTKNGKTFPGMLSDKIRVTSANRLVVDAFVEVYGGEVRPWDDGQWEAYLPVTALPIMVLPGQSVTQWWELYKGGVCDRRCEGAGGTETISGKPCMCNPNVEQRQADRSQCSLMTRLNFICPEVNVVGAGSLVTHGRIAAETLPQAVAVAEAALRQGQMVPAVLRSVTRIGKNRQYVVPQIEIVGISLQSLMSGETDGVLRGGGAEGAIGPSGGTSEPQPSPEPEPVRAIPASVVQTGSTSSTSPALSDSPPASEAIRAQITKQAAKRGLDDEAVADLALEVTGKYVEETSFSVDDANKVLDALRSHKP
jgi:hypothetical protein